MERDLNNDEFEIFLKQKADQHKLYPSDRAWKGIYNSLHPGMKWFKIGGTLLILSTLFLVYQQTSFFNSSDLSTKNNKFNKKISLNGSSASATGAILTNTKVSGIFSRKIQAQNSTEKTAEQSISGIPVTTAGSQTDAVSLNPVNEVSIGLQNQGSLVAHGSLKGFLLHNIQTLGLSSPANVAIPANHVATVAKQDNLSEVDNTLVKPLLSTVIGNTIESDEAVSVKDQNWLQEMAAIKLTPQKKSKLNLQFYFSPTVSYRRLADNQNISHSGILNASPVSRDLNINRYVDHNPAIGAELGSNMLFSVTRNFTLKSGIQLNYSRYNIKAFKAPYEKASIALSTAGRVADTISSYTSFRNLSGYASEELQNQYLQVSVPLGAELKLAGNKRLQFSVAGTIQPTFLLFSDTYLLSTNYMNYTKEPSLVRKWNVHSAFEAFVSYKTGGLRWQVGPQFRYQLMSSFIDRYPIKEYLFEYGLKIGVSKTLR